MKKSNLASSEPGGHNCKIDERHGACSPNRLKIRLDSIAHINKMDDSARQRLVEKALVNHTLGDVNVFITHTDKGDTVRFAFEIDGIVQHDSVTCFAVE